MRSACLRRSRRRRVQLLQVRAALVCWGPWVRQLPVDCRLHELAQRRAAALHARCCHDLGQVWEQEQGGAAERLGRDASAGLPTQGLRLMLSPPAQRLLPVNNPVGEGRHVALGSGAGWKEQQRTCLPSSSGFHCQQPSMP